MGSEETRSDRTVTESAGDHVGRYRLLRILGEGGFGTVWMAEQSEPVRRRVALKVLRAGMDTEQVLARFEAERQALALMDHPSIAQVFDGGATATGRPYFVMELVKGVPVTEYCDEARLGLRDRLRLFVRVCRAIQHAHHKGVVHRDVKPSNVLVTTQDGEAVPKVIDFGVAKATDAVLTRRTLVTEIRQVIGSPEYMAPEQAEVSALDVDTRADVYSLGVLLYELVTGTRPFDLRTVLERGYDELLRTIREETPVKPSTRVSSLGEAAQRLARLRATDAGRWGRALRGDLDWIVLKALEKDRTRRYETAAGLALDVERFLADEPIEARPPGALYQIGKLVKRHRAAVSSAAALLVLLAGFGVWMSVLYARAAAAEARASREAATAHEVIGFLTELFDVPDPSHARGDSITAREVLDAGVQRIDLLEGQTAVQSRLLSTMGRVYRQLGLYDRAVELLERSVALLEPEADAAPRRLAEAVMELASAHRLAGRYDEAAPLLERARAIADERGFAPGQRARILSVQGNLAFAQSEYDRAQALLEEALAIQEQAGPEERESLGGTLNSLGAVLLVRGDHEEAVVVLERCIAILEELLGEDHPRVPSALNNLGEALRELGRLDEARPVYERALAIRERILEPDHPDLANSIDNLANVYYARADYETAGELYDRAIAIRRAALGPDHPHLATSLNNVASIERERGDVTRAIELYEEARDIWSRSLGPAHPQVGIPLHNLACIHRERGRFEEAEEAFVASRRIWEAKLRPDHPYVLLSLDEHAESRRAAGDEAGARELEALAAERRGGSVASH